MNRGAAIPVEEVVEELAPQRRFRRYSEYRDSGIEGVHAVPTHWRDKPLKYVATVNADKLADTTDPDYELEYVDIGNVSLIDGVTSTESYRFENAPSRARRRVQPGDTIVSTVRTYLKAVARIDEPPENLVVSTGFAVLHAGPELDSAYLYRFIHSDAFVERVVAHSVGVSYPAINPSDLLGLPIPIPPLDEQRAIAAFLDRETARIDELIGKKQRLIELLAEKRTALITHAVTKGLNPDAAMKNSGIDWLGAIPSHWTVALFKHVAKTSYGVGGEIDRTLTEGTLTLSLPNIGIQGQINVKDVPFAELTGIQKSDVLLRPGDLLFNWRNGSSRHLGKTAYFDLSGEYSHVSFLLRLRIDPTKHDSRYFHRLLNGLRITGFFSSSKAGVNNTFNQSELDNLWVMWPPLDEQRAIADYLDRETGRIDGPATRLRDAIDKLEEYRSALISAAVTGKIDVRANSGVMQ